MKFLLFLLGFVFFYIFFVFSQYTEVRGNILNIFYQANFYVFLSLGTIFLLWKQEMFQNKDHNTEIDREQEDKKEVFITREKVFWWLKIFFSHMIFPLACILFYWGLFLFAQSIFPTSSLPYIFLWVNIFLVFLYFSWKENKLIQRFIAINTSLLSLYYIGLHIVYIFWISWAFQIIDFLNIFIIWVFFYICIRSQSFLHYVKIFYIYILSFLYFEGIILWQFLFWETILSIFWVFSLWGIMLLYFTGKISHILSISKWFIRLLGLNSIFLSLIAALFLWEQNTLVVLYIIGIHIFMSYILYLFHMRFENYLSLFFSLFSLSFICIYWYFTLSNTVDFLFYVVLLLSFGILIYDTLTSDIYQYDSYVFHIFSLLVNISSCIFFFIYIDISILSVSLLLIGESIYLFLSYYTLPKKDDTLYPWFESS